MIPSTDLLNAITIVATRLGSLADEVVFLGGATLGLLLTDPAAAPPRATKDIDVIADIRSHVAYHALGAQLRARGFSEDVEEGPLICRWIVDGIKVDVMPTAGEVLGFTNRWYPQALACAQRRELPGGLIVRVVTAPYFLATKLDAFRDRGKRDYMGSSDLEDVIALVDGRDALDREVAEAETDVRDFIRAELSQYLAEPEFIDALPGHLLPDPASQSRLPLLLDRLQRLAAL